MMLDLIVNAVVTIDTFIELDAIASLQCNRDHQHCSLCIPFGTKLGVSKVQKIWGGNSGNAAVGAARLGLTSALYSEVGLDQDGNLIFDSLRHSNVSTKYLVRDKTEKTNIHYVLSYHGERTILVHHQPRKYIFPHLDMARWVYFSSTAKDGKKILSPLLQYLQKTNAKLAFNPGTYQLNWGISGLKSIIQKCAIFFVNKEEAQLLLGTSSADFGFLMKKLCTLGPKITVITDGENGAYCYDGINFLYCPIYKVSIVERTGAGDSFAIGFVSALIYGKSISEALRWGSINAAGVIQQIGPQEGLVRLPLLQRILNTNTLFKPRNFTGKEMKKNRGYLPKKYKRF